MMALQGHVPDFAVFGDDYDTPDGTAIRDYIHVTDLAVAHVLALKLLLGGHSGGAFNLGTGNGFSVREILAAIAAETGREVPHVVKPRRSGDPTYLVADPSAARATLNFRPAHSDLATIIRTAWAWHKKAHPLKAREPNLQRLDLHLAEFDHAGTVLERERSPRIVLAVLHVSGLLAVEDDDEMRALRGDVEGVPFARRFRHRINLGDVDNRAGAIARVRPLVEDVDLIADLGVDLVPASQRMKMPLLASSSVQNSALI